jgi:thymidine phosphorylase
MQGGHLLQMAGLVDTVEAGQMKILSTFSDGSAKHHWDLMCESQGVSNEVINQMRDYLETGEYKFTLHSNIDGWVDDIDAMELAKVLSELGAGRSELGQEIDHSVGAIINANVGTQVSEGDLILTVEHQNDELSEEIMTRLESCISVSASPISVPDRLIEVIK